MDLGLDPDEQRLLADVAEHGWHAVVVAGDHRTGLPGHTPVLGGVAYAYTVGLTATYRHPELIVFGLEPATMRDLLAVAVRGIDAGRMLAADTRVNRLVHGYALATRGVHRVHLDTLLRQATWYRRFVQADRHVDAVQLYWPDRAGLFPWEEGCDPGVAALQPPLNAAG